MPVAVSRLGGVTAISAGFRHSLALLSNGTVMAWGDNEYGQLGNGTETESVVPAAVDKLNGVKAISAGHSQSLAAVVRGTVMAWGDNEEGQLGDGAHTGPEQCGISPFFACSKTPVPVSGLSGAAAISAGVHSLALLTNGIVMAWGANRFGQLGDGTHTGPEMCSPFAIPCSTAPVEVREPKAVVGISAGAAHSLAFGPSPPTGPLPELGRCVKVASGGAYAGTSPRCTTPSTAHTGHFEWLPGPGWKAGFKDQLNEPQLETVAKHKLNCAAALVEGEYTGPKTETINHLTLDRCVDVTSNASCQSNPAEVGVIESSLPLTGDLGFIKSGERPSVGWDLEPKPPATSLVSFECGAGVGAAAVALEGSAIARAAPLDQMVSAFELLYTQSGGKQVPEFFEGGPRDVLTLTTTPFIGPKTSERVGLRSKGLRAGEEPLELKAKA